VINIFSFEIADGTVGTIRSIINPHKLGHLGPLADVRGLWRDRHTAGG
jgi:RNA polymerase sigma-70 factor (ECF subfamily)